MVPDRPYIIGIDLGTTNSAVSYVACHGNDSRERKIRIFEIPQLTGPGEISVRRMLPSFLYLPGEHEIHQNALSVPWSKNNKQFVGAFARDHGVRVPKRMIASAKSWLCHDRVDRKAPILPWGADEDMPRLSPVSATAAYLQHIKEAWNHAQGDNDALYLENQMVIITVPASFDEVARDLTVEAAQQAGIKHIILLEEPLAAFYHWLSLHENEWTRVIRPGELILVCDIGGGTTDFTLISVKKQEKEVAFDRIAVGDHLILGGDNMDLALARRLEMRLKKRQKGSLNLARWYSLCYQSRNAKEKILSGGADSEIITLVGESQRLIAGTVSTTLDREETESVIIDGFFPLIDPGESLAEIPRKGITEFGLPYEKDPAITRQLIRFLNHHRNAVSEMLSKDSPLPDLILFNGGALKPVAIQERIREAIRHWFHETDAALPRVLVNPDLDLAVAQGASYYGLVRQGRGVRVGSGSPRAYYLGVGKAEDERSGTPRAICVVERGMEEGRHIKLEEQQFQVVANQPVIFDLYSSSFRMGDRIGDVVSVDESLTPLPPIRTVIQFGKKGKQTKLPVAVEAHYTETGTLSLWCRSIQTTHRWQLQFQLRDTDDAAPVPDGEVFEESSVDRALDTVKTVFSNDGSAVSPEHVTKTIAEIVNCPKENWPLGFLRPLADTLLELDAAKQQFPEYESRWLNLTGFCLRPGFGEVLDGHRIQRLWRRHPAGPVNKKNPQVRSEWWVLWRRVAGGLNNHQQRLLLQEILPLIRPKKKSAKIRLAPQEHLEIWMLLANLERLPVTEKADLGMLLLQYLSPKKSRPQYWWALSRIGAREPFYGTIDRVVPPETVSEWIEEILSISWRNPVPVGGALGRMARLTGDRNRDLDASVLERVIQWLNNYDWSEPHVKCLREVVPIRPQEESAIFGETLPPGLLLHTGNQ